MSTKKIRTVTLFLFVGLTFLLSLSGVRPAMAIPTSPAQSITLNPASGAPGSEVVVQGSGFSTGGGGEIDIYWDSTSSPRIGSGPSVGRDGTFATTATIPPNATAGSHTIIARDNYTSDEAEATFTVVGDPLAAVYIYNTDQDKADDFKALLEETGMISTTVKQLSDVAMAAVDFSLYDLIIIGPDTGNWENNEAVARVRDSGKPILGLGEGGYAFFGKLQLHIGYPHGAHSTTTTQVRPVDLSHTIYQTPYDGFPSPVTVYGSGTGSVEIHLPSPPSGVLTLGRHITSDDHYSLVQQSGRYFLWGFDGGPRLEEMTTNGQHLFVNVAWHLLLFRSDVDTLILTDYQRMKDVGYLSANVNTLEGKVNTLVGMPKSQSNMTAVVKRMNLDTPTAVKTARTTWIGNDDSVANTNAYVTAIDNYIESLKQGVYPNLQYVIFVGAHEVIPMKARPADDMDSPYKESEWASGLPQTSGYFYSLYHDTSGGATRGHYLTDSIYGDLSYINNGYGDDNELIPELAVGRLVETPSQISTLLDNYMASNATFSRSNMASIASNDYMDGGQAAANHMGASADTALIQSTFNTSLVPPKINANDDFVYLAGHGNYNYIARGFMAGSHATEGDTEELNANLSDAVIVASGCHNGVNFGNKRYHDYAANTTYGEFPERFANKGVGIYLGSTGYTWISGSGSSTNTAHNGWSEKLATHFINHLLNDGMWTTAGKAYKAAVNEYVSDYGGVGNPHRRVLAIATLYGIPNYHPPRLIFVAPWRPISYLLVRQWLVWPLASDVQTVSAVAETATVAETTTATETVTLEITDWYTDSSGLVNIPGASYTGDQNEPILPVVHASHVLPGDANVVTVIWNQTESVSTTISNDVPLATIAVLTTTITGTYPYTDTFYPTTPYYTSTVTTLGGGAVEVGMNIVPVQYKQSTHQTRIWTTMIFQLVYEIDPYALGMDSDGDDLPDYWESGYGLSPNDDSGDQGASGDPDEDGLTNEQERGLGTDPLDPDTDHDGSNDGQEVADETDPLNPGSRLMHIYLPLAMRNYTGTASSP